MPIIYTLESLTAEMIIDGCHQGVLLARGSFLCLKHCYIYIRDKIML